MKIKGNQPSVITNELPQQDSALLQKGRLSPESLQNISFQSSEKAKQSILPRGLTSESFQQQFNQELEGELKALLQAPKKSMKSSSTLDIKTSAPATMEESFQKMGEMFSQLSAENPRNHSFKLINKDLKELQALFSDNGVSFQHDLGKMCQEPNQSKELTKSLDTLVSLLQHLESAFTQVCKPAKGVNEVPMKTKSLMPQPSQPSQQTKLPAWIENMSSGTSAPGTSVQGSPAQKLEKPNFSNANFANDLNATPSSEYKQKLAKAFQFKDEGALAEVVKNPHAVASLSFDEKVQVLKGLQEFKGGAAGAEAAYDVLSTCKSQEEFDAMVGAIGGKEGIAKMASGHDAHTRINRLCGMWGRPELSTNKKDAEFAPNAMLEHDFSNAQNFSGDFISDATDISRNGRSLVDLLATNARRKREGKEPIDIQAVDKKFAQVNRGENVEVNGKSFDFQKEYTVEELQKLGIDCSGGKVPSSNELKRQVQVMVMKEAQKEFGLSDYEVKHIVMNRFGNAQDQMATIITAEGKQRVSQLSEQYNQVIQQLGENSPEAQELLAQIKEVDASYAREVAEAKYAAHHINRKEKIQIGFTGMPNPDVPAAKNMTPEEVQRYQVEIQGVIKGDDWGRMIELAKDPKAMACASPDQKSKFIEAFTDGYTRDREDMAIYHVLASATSKEEFEYIMNKHGGKDLIDDEMDYNEAKSRLNGLCGMWSHPEWSTNKAEALKSKDVLADPLLKEKLSGFPPTLGLPIPTTGKKTGDLAKDSISQNDAERNQMLERPDFDHKSMVELLMGNSRREAEGQEPLKFKEINEEFNKIYRNEAVTIGDKTYDPNKDYSDDELRALGIDIPDPKKWEAMALMTGAKNPRLEELKKDRKGTVQNLIRDKAREELKKHHGLSNNTMAELFTHRSSAVHKESSVSLQKKAVQTISYQKQEYKNAVLQFGAESPQAKALEEELKKSEREYNDEISHLDKIATHLDSLYHVPPSAMDKFVEGLYKFAKIFKQILDVVVAVVAAVVPGVGQIVGAVYYGAQMIYNACKGDWLGALSSGLGMLGGVGGAVGGAIGQGISTAAKVIDAGKGVVEGIVKGDPLAAISSLGSVAGGIGGIGGIGKSASSALKMANNVVQGGAAVYQVGEGIAKGDINQIFGGLSQGVSAAGAFSDDPKFQETLGKVQTGVNMAYTSANVVQGAVNGNWDQVLAGAGATLSQASGLAEGKTAEVLKSVGSGVNAIQAIRSGDYSGAVQSFSDALEPALGDNKTYQDVMGYIKPAVNITENVMNGNYLEAASTLNQKINEVAGDNPVVQKATHYLQKTVEFTEGIRTGDYGSSIQILANETSKLVDNPELKKGFKWAGDFGVVAQRIAAHPDPLRAIQLIGSSEPIQEFLSSQQNGSFLQGLQGIGNQFKDFMGNPAVQKGIEFFKTGSELVKNIGNGNVLKSFQGLQSLPLERETKQHLDFLMEQHQNFEEYLNFDNRRQATKNMVDLHDSNLALFGQPQVQGFYNDFLNQQAFIQQTEQGQFSDYYGSLDAGFRPFLDSENMNELVEGYLAPFLAFKD